MISMMQALLQEIIVLGWAYSMVTVLVGEILR